MKKVFNSIEVGVGGITTGLNGGKQVELRQKITTHYDDSNNLADSLFDGVRQSFDETRVTWRGVPEEATKEIVAAELSKYPEARLRKFLSHEPILNDGQDLVYRSGFRGPNAAKAFADFIAKNEIKATEWNDECRAKFLAIVTESQLVKYGKDSKEGKAEDPILFNGKKQYKVIAFTKEAKADVDMRIEKAVAESIIMTGETVAEAVEA